MKKEELEKPFIALVTEYQRVIYKVCYMYATDEYTLEELYQETVINLWKAFPQFKEHSKVSTWVYRIAMNTCISYFRKSSVRPTTIPITFHMETTLADDSEQSGYLRELYRMISQLGKLDRALILLWLEDKSYQEIADIIGITKANVAVKINRIKEKLKKMSNA
ncbi:MAG: sigma-70 family RNA polymerase sigma factor [Bacteroidaceae bacterium]|nr:sigma-70 family RNA polymerase sigma factor [Bacteroidaceae bacterium]